MRAAVLGAAVALALVCAGCAAGAPAEEPAVSLEAEQERLEGEVGHLAGVSDVEVRLRSGATHGRQVLIDASADGSSDGLLVVDELTRAGWHTQAFVPTEVRVTVVLDGGSLTPRDLGFARHGADSAGLYDRYGPPAADEDWQP